jgi:hypothetical protein
MEVLLQTNLGESSFDEDDSPTNKHTRLRASVQMSATSIAPPLRKKRRRVPNY